MELNQNQQSVANSATLSVFRMYSRYTLFQKFKSSHYIVEQQRKLLGKEASIISGVNLIPLKSFFMGPEGFR